MSVRTSCALYHRQVSASQSVWMAVAVASLRRVKANGWTVHSRLTESSRKVKGFPVRQCVRVFGLSVVSSASSRHAAERASGSVGSMLPAIGARWCLDREGAM